MNAIEAKNLSKAYGDVKALKGVSFSVKKGEIIGLLGPNGAGKTTLMKILTGYLQSDDGSAKIVGNDITFERKEAQKNIGYLPENAPVYRDMSVQDYLMWMADLREIPIDQKGKMLHLAVEQTGLGNYLKKRISTLSKGYRQRVGLAQALVHKPSLLILDEPTTGLDPNQIVEIRDVLVELAKTSTIVLSTHILPEVERVCQRVLLIAGGTLRADSSLDDLQSSESAWVKLKGQSDTIDALLASAKGVTKVNAVGALDSEGFQCFRVMGQDGASLCPALFEVLKTSDVSVAELRPDSRNLETVFADLANSSPSMATKENSL